MAMQPSKQKIFVSSTAVFPDAEITCNMTFHATCRGIWNLPSLSANSICPLHTRHNGIKAWWLSQAAGLWVDKLTVTLFRFQHPVTLCFMKNNSFEKWLGMLGSSFCMSTSHPNSFSLLLKHWAPNKQLQSEMFFFFFFPPDSRCLSLNLSCLQTIRMCVVGISTYSRLLSVL